MPSGFAETEKLLRDLAKRLKGELFERRGSGAPRRGRPILRVLAEGVPLSLDETSVHSLAVAQHAGLVDSFALALAPGVREPGLAQGARVAIELGWEGGRAGTVISGEVTGCETRFGEAGGPALTVHGLAFDHRLNRGRRTRVFAPAPGRAEVRDAEVARRIAEEAGLKPGQIEETPLAFVEIVQENQTDLELLRGRARLYDCEVTVEGGEMLHFRKCAAPSEAAARLRRGRELKEFRARMDGAPRAAAVGAAPGAPAVSPEHAKAIARSVLSYYAYGVVSGEGAAHGDPAIRPGATIELEGVGKRFDGKYAVEAATHVFERKSYTTTFSVHRPGPARSADPAAVPPTSPARRTFFEFLAGLEGARVDSRGPTTLLAPETGVTALDPQSPGSPREPPR